MSEERVRRNRQPAAIHESANRQRHAPGGQQERSRPSRRLPSSATSAATSIASQQRTSRPARVRGGGYGDLPAVAPCQDLDILRRLSADEARHHVNRYLHTVMTAQQADDFEALAYRWELHLVELDQIYLVRQIDMNRRKLSRYRTALRKGAAFPPLIALGGDGPRPTENVLLCDGYHRIIAMRDIGLHFAWIWLAVSVWHEPPLPQHMAPALAHIPG